MKTRNIAILGGIIALILILTVAEKFAERRQLQRNRVETTQQQTINLDSVSTEHNRRWQALSRHTRRVLDSLSDEVQRYRALVDSLSQVPPSPVQAQTSPSIDSVVKELPVSAQPVDSSLAIAAGAPDTAAIHPITDPEIAAEYFRGLAALPNDLNAYEKRVATNEVASLVREKYDLTRPRLEELLRQNPRSAVLANDT